jgi:hypothetical protein
MIDMTPLSLDFMGRISLGTFPLEDGKAVVPLPFVSIVYSIFMNFFAVEANNTLSRYADVAAKQYYRYRYEHARALVFQRMRIRPSLKAN